MNQENKDFQAKCETLQRMNLEFIQLVNEKEDIILNQKSQELLKITNQKLNELQRQIDDLQAEVNSIGWVVQN